LAESADDSPCCNSLQVHPFPTFRILFPGITLRNRHNPFTPFSAAAAVKMKHPRMNSTRATGCGSKR
jgi:hypothetical protein